MCRDLQKSRGKENLEPAIDPQVAHLTLTEETQKKHYKLQSLNIAIET